MRIIAYLKKSKIALLLIVLLLIVQAFADLSLPRYTSDLVDVGIQQGGVEDATPSVMSESTFNYVCMLSSSDADEQLFKDSYAKNEEGRYELTEQGQKNREEINSKIALPLVIVSFADQISQNASSQASTSSSAQASASSSVSTSDSSQASVSSSSSAQIQSFNLADLYRAYSAGVISKAQINSLVDQARASFGSIDDSLIEQQAISAVKAEYESLGMDMGALQLNYLISIGLQMLGVTALMVVVSVLVGLIASRTAARIAATLREKLFERVITFSDAEVQSFSAASLITRGTNDIQQIQMVIVMLLRMVLYSPILAIGGIIMVSQTNVSMSWVIVLAVVVIALAIVILMALALPKFKMMQQLIDRVNLVAREMLSGLQVVRAFGRQDYEEARFDQASRNLYKTQLFTNRTMTFMMPTMMLVMNATSVLIVWVGGHSIDAGTMQTGDMIAFITYAMVIVMSFLMIGMIAIMLPRANVAAERVNEVLEAHSSIKDPAQSSFAEIDKTAEGLPVCFDGVTFSYNKDSEPVLRDISFTAEPGCTTAIIGSTGSGKSTILKLIERFYDVGQGSVSVGDVDVRSISQHELRSLIGYVPQKAFLFSGTIEETIGYGINSVPEEEGQIAQEVSGAKAELSAGNLAGSSEGASTESDAGSSAGVSADDSADSSAEASSSVSTGGHVNKTIEKAAQIAQATEFINAKESGFNTRLSQGGTNVSGGQRQRLSIARALATDAKILLFDDSFSALDYATDARLRAALAQEAGGKTVIVVAQRISTVLNADKIVVLDEGEIVGYGTHKELLETCNTYQEIASSQLSEEELKGGERS